MGHERKVKINKRYVKDLTPEQRQDALDSKFGRTLVDRKFVARVIETYDTKHVQPLRDWIAYQELWPHQKLWLWLMSFDRLHDLQQKVTHWLYARGWLKPKVAE